MLTLEQTFTIIALIFAFSGWGKIIYEWQTSKPKIKGKIFNVMTGSSGPPVYQEEMTVFLPYLYLTNARKNTVHILDYILELDRGHGYERVKRVYGAHTVPNWTFGSGIEQIRIDDFPNKLITVNAEPVQYGVPLHGWLLFASEKSQEEFENVKRWKITCIDAFDNNHEIVTCREQFPPLYLLQDIAGIKIPKSAIRK